MKKKQQPIADFDNITAADLASDQKLRLLYCEAVRRKFWTNDAGRALDFFSLAQKAITDDKHGTPGKLFYSLIKRKNMRFVTDAMEDAARKRLAGGAHDLVEMAANLTLTALPVPQEAQEALLGRDIGYYHGVMMQCFLPQKEQPIERRSWKIKHGQAALAVQAGIIADRENVGDFLDCALPSGAKARLIIPYIIGYAVQRNTREIDMGSSLRRFMDKIKVPITGPNGKALTREVQNVAAANFVIGGWNEHGVTTTKGSSMRFQSVAFPSIWGIWCSSNEARAGWICIAGCHTARRSYRTGRRSRSGWNIYSRSSHLTSATRIISRTA